VAMVSMVVMGFMGSVPGETNNRDANMQVGRGGVDNEAKRCLWASPMIRGVW